MVAGWTVASLQGSDTTRCRVLASGSLIARARGKRNTERKEGKLARSSPKAITRISFIYDREKSSFAGRAKWYDLLSS